MRKKERMKETQTLMLKTRLPVASSVHIAIILEVTATDARSEAAVWVAADQGAGGVGVGCAVPAATIRVAMTTTSVAAVLMDTLPGGASCRYPSAAPDTTAELSSETL